MCVGSEAPAEPDERLQRLSAFLAEHAWLADCHTASFFTQRLWERVQPGWLDALAALPRSQLHAVPAGHTQPGWPPALVAFVGGARALSLPSQPKLAACPQPPPPEPCACSAALQRALCEGVCAKKRHEVEALAALVARVARQAGADAVVDVGAGQGNLSRSLAFHHGLRVVSLDAVAPLTASAHQRTQRLCRLRRCAAHAEAPAPPVALTARFAWGTKEGAAALKLALAHALPPPATPRRILLVGLHACGDLTPAILRTFAACPCACAVVAVGCCHNLLTEAGACGAGERAAADAILRSTALAAARRVRGGAEEGVSSSAQAQPEEGQLPPGFPLSSAGALACPSLGRRARMLACQSGERWQTEQGAPSESETRRHAFRAALELVLERHAPHARGAVKAPRADAREEADDGAAFASYALAALAAAGVCCGGAGLTRESLAALWLNELSAAAALVGPFCALRAVLAAPLESLIVLDRLAFLREALAEGGNAFAQPVFDPRLSPRNIALVAIK